MKALASTTRASHMRFCLDSLKDPAQWWSSSMPLERAHRTLFRHLSQYSSSISSPHRLIGVMGAILPAACTPGRLLLLRFRAQHRSHRTMTTGTKSPLGLSVHNRSRYSCIGSPAGHAGRAGQMQAAACWSSARVRRCCEVARRWGFCSLPSKSLLSH